MKPRAVSLRRNGEYWQAAYRDEYGNPVRISLGNRANVSRSDALSRCAEIATTVAKPAGPMTLEAWGERYLDLRGELSEKTIARHRLAIRYLVEKFGAGTRLDRITPAPANTFVAWLREKQSSRSKLPLSDFSVHSMVTLAKEVTEWAVKDGRIARSPFADVRMKTPKIQRKRPYIAAERVRRVMESCPHAGWRAMWGLCRLAGLRASEAMYLRFDEIDQERAVLRVWPRQERQTTKQALREVPISPELMAVIDEARDAAADGEERVAWGLLASTNYNHDAREIMRKAGESWPEPFKACRAALETDWQSKYPALAVAAWLGHDIRVSLKHYFQDEHLTSLVTGDKKSFKTETHAQSALPEDHAANLERIDDMPLKDLERLFIFSHPCQPSTETPAPESTSTTGSSVKPQGTTPASSKRSMRSCPCGNQVPSEPG